MFKINNTKLTILGTLLTLGFIASLGGGIFIISGVYDIAAIRPHTPMVRWLLTATKRNAIKTHAKELKVPDLLDADLIKRGLILYRTHCVTCHGAPGEARSRIGIGVNPTPPPLEKAIAKWTAAEIAWITAMGLKMAGMPAFGLGEEPGDLWALTAFVVRMNTLSPRDYRLMKEVTDNDLDTKVAWLPEEDLGWETLEEKGEMQSGRKLIDAYGCGGCHRIPGIQGAVGMAGPPLDEWADRHYIAGLIVNYPRNMVRWLMHTQHFEPGSVMPNLDISEDEAWKISSYLFSLEKRD